MADMELPDHFENQEAMEAIVEKVHADMQAEKAASEAAQPDAVEATPIKEDVVTTTTETPVQSPDDAHPVEAIPVAPTSDEGQKPTPPAKKGQEWLDAGLRSLAMAVGVSEDKLSEFGSRQELERALDLVDSHALELGRQKLAEQTSVKTEEKPVATPDVGEAKPVETKAGDVSKFLLPDDYPDDVVKPHNEFVKATEARMKILEAKLARFEEVEHQRSAYAVRQKFIGVVESLGHPELFGTAENRTPEQMERVSKLWDHHRAHVTGLVAEGRRGETNKPFVERAMYAVFGKDLIEKGKQEVVSGLKAQSAKRMGGPSGKPMRDVNTGKHTPTENPAVMAELKAEFASLEAGG
jgi:hypothetical protein